MSVRVRESEGEIERGRESGEQTKKGERNNK